MARVPGIALGAVLCGMLAAAVIRPSPVSSADAKAGLPAAIDAYVTAQMNELHIPGLALALIVDGRIAYERGYGVADASGRPVTPHTPFILGSTSKQLTGIAVQQLVQSGRLDLDAPVNRYLQWSGSDGHSLGAITIRQLLGHTSGISTPQGVENWLDDGGADDTLDANAHRLADEQPTQLPGAGFEYSNANYDLLGYLVQVVSGEPYGRYLRDHVLNPLGMHETYTDLGAARAAGLADGYYPWFGLVALPTPMPYPRSGIPSSFVISTAHDLALEVVARLGQLPAEETDVDARVLAATEMPLARVDRYDEYASGWLVHRFWPVMTSGQDPNDPSLPLMYEHDGTASTYRSYIGFVPDRRFGLVMTMNAMDEVVPSRWGFLNDGVIRIAVGGRPQQPVVAEDFLRQYARPLYLAGLFVEVAVCWLSLRQRRRRGVAVAAGAVVTAAILWLVLVYAPSSAGNAVPTLIRRAPDLGLVTILIVVIAVLWLLGLAYRLRARPQARIAPG